MLREEALLTCAREIAVGPGKRNWFGDMLGEKGGAWADPPFLARGTKLMGVLFTDIGGASNLGEEEDLTHTFSWLLIIYILVSFI